MDDAGRLSSAQVAARLHVKVETLYAYVARGLLHSARADDGGSTFDPLEVEWFAESRTRGAAGAAASARMQGRPIMVLDSDIALIDGDRLYFRGTPADYLAQRMPFDDAVAFLWATPTSGDDIDQRFVSRPDVVAAVRRAAKALGPYAGVVDRLTTAVVTAGSWDPVRDATAPSAVRDAGRQIIATMVDSLPSNGTGSAVAGTVPVANRLWPRLGPADATASDLRLLNATMVLCMDNDLAVSTMAARVAASSRANPYAAVAAALSAFDSPMHGAASVAAGEMLTETMRGGNAERALARQLKATGVIPGFGHIVYRREDPRARFLLSAMRRMPRFEEPMLAADRLVAAVASRSRRPANLDLALAVLTVGAEMRPDAGELIFAVSRTAGWIAHIIDEYMKPALRLRPESRYTGPPPVE